MSEAVRLYGLRGHDLARAFREAAERENSRFLYAAEEIERQLARIEALEAALRPFVHGSAEMEAILWGGMPDDATGTITARLGDFRRARAALHPTER